MKKTYNTPEMMVTKINKLAIIATSGDPQVDPTATEGSDGWGDAQTKERGTVDFSSEDSWK